MYGWVLRGLLLIVVLFVGTLFALQNSEFTSGLGLNLGFAAWELKDPAPVPVLMLSSLGVGLFVGAAWGLTRSRRGHSLGPTNSGPDW